MCIYICGGLIQSMVCFESAAKCLKPRQDLLSENWFTKHETAYSAPGLNQQRNWHAIDDMYISHLLGVIVTLCVQLETWSFKSFSRDRKSARTGTISTALFVNHKWTTFLFFVPVTYVTCFNDNVWFYWRAELSTTDLLVSRIMLVSTALVKHLSAVAHRTVTIRVHFRSSLGQILEACDAGSHASWI